MLSSFEDVLVSRVFTKGNSCADITANCCWLQLIMLDILLNKNQSDN